jgi:hypothetical protein
MSSSASNKAYDTLIKLWDKLTRLTGVITPEAIDKLKDKLGGIFTMAKIHHYTQGQKYGHLASAITKSKYRLIIGNATCTHTVPTNPERTPQMPSMPAMRQPRTNSLWHSKNQAKEVQGLPEHWRGREGTHPLCSWQQRSCSPQEVIYWLWQHNVTSNDQPSTPEDGNQDDDRAKIRVQDKRVQHPLGPNDEHNSVLLAT